jgi:hypothetical protein
LTAWQSLPIWDAGVEHWKEGTRVPVCGDTVTRVPSKYSRPMEGKPPYWLVEGRIVMNGNLSDSRLRNAEKQGLRSRLSLHVLLRDDRLQLLFSHFCRAHISLVEDRPGEIGPLQIHANASSLGERSPGEIDPL